MQFAKKILNVFLKLTASYLGPNFIATDFVVLNLTSN